MKTSVKYRIHRTTAIIVLPLLIISIVTGFFRANQKWYWEDGYKKKKHASAISIDKPLVSISSLVQKIDSVSQKKNKFQEISIQTENEELYYKLVTSSKEKYLIEAYTGKMVSPLTSKLAADIALQYVKEKPAIQSCELLEKYKARKGRETKPTYKVVFDNKVHSEIYVDPDTGEIIEDIDDNRKFGIWVLRLHEYDFFDSKRSITSVVGMSMLLLSFSGLWIYKIRSKNKRLNSHKLNEKRI